MLSVDANGVKVTPVDEDLKPVDVRKVDCGNSSAGPLVNAMQLIFQNLDEEFSWSGESVDFSAGLSLAQYEKLVPFLFDCRDILVDEKGSCLDFDMDQTYAVTYKAMRMGDDRYCSYKGSFLLDDGSEVNGFLSPGLALIDGAVRSVVEVGSGYAFAHIFTTEFKFFDLESTLSMLLSAMSDISVEIDGWKTRRGKTISRKFR